MTRTGGLSPDPHAVLRDRALDRVLRGPGETDTALRVAAANCADLPAALRELVEKIHHHAYKVTDEDIERLKAQYGDDRMFEIVVSAALGASRRRLFAGLEALGNA